MRCAGDEQAVLLKEHFGFFEEEEVEGGVGEPPRRGRVIVRVEEGGRRDDRGSGWGVGVVVGR